MAADSKKMALAVTEALEEKKANNIKIIQIGELSPITDYFVIADGSNTSQVEAMTEAVKEAMYKLSVKERQITGTTDCGWVLLDYNDIVVHVFHSENRSFYNLERVWKDGKIITKEDLLA